METLAFQLMRALELIVRQTRLHLSIIILKTNFIFHPIEKKEGVVLIFTNQKGNLTYGNLLKIQNNSILKQMRCIWLSLMKILVIFLPTERVQNMKVESFAVMIFFLLRSLKLTLFLQKLIAVSYTHLRAHETLMNLVCRLLLEKKHLVW